MTNQDSSSACHSFAFGISNLNQELSRIYQLPGHGVNSQREQAVLHLVQAALDGSTGRRGIGQQLQTDKLSVERLLKVLKGDVDAMGIRCRVYLTLAARIAMAFRLSLPQVCTCAYVS
jgi:hypothetical protein